MATTYGYESASVEHLEKEQSDTLRSMKMMSGTEAVSAKEETNSSPLQCAICLGVGTQFLDRIRSARPSIMCSS